MADKYPQQLTDLEQEIAAEQDSEKLRQLNNKLNILKLQFGVYHKPADSEYECVGCGS